MAITCSKKRWALVLVPLVLINIAPVIVGVYFWTRDGNDNDDNITRPEVTIAQRTLRGVNMETYYGRCISSFKGIPIAQLPPYTKLAPSVSEMNEDDRKMADTMVQLWTSFTITGTPTTADSDNNVIWKPFSTNGNYLRIGNNSDTSLGVESDYLRDRAQFWEELNGATSWL